MNGTDTQQPDPVLDQELRDAEAILYCDVEVTDPETGAMTRRRMETPLYRDYLEQQRAYNDARVAYTTALQEAQKTALGRATWPMVASTKQLPVKQAYDRWRAGGAGKVEQALATINRGRPV